MKLADLYMNSSKCRQKDAMKAIDLLTEALTLGCAEKAGKVLLELREQLFPDDEDNMNINALIRWHSRDEICFAAFCLGVGLGWREDIASSKRLFELALSRGYTRAAYYLESIRTRRW